MVMVAEGVETTKSVYQLAKKHGIEMPITAEVYKALFEDKSPREAVKDLMLRQLRPERMYLPFRAGAKSILLHFQRFV